MLRTAVLAVLVLAPFARVAAQAPSSPTSPPYEESVVVREAEVVVQAPEGLSESRRRGLAPGSLLVLEDGAFRDVTSVQPLETKEGEWTVVVAFERAFVAPETLFRSALALGHRAERLARLGNVEVVETGPAFRRWLLPTRDGAAIAQAFADLAASTRPAGTAAAAVPPTVDLAGVHEASQRLLAEVVGRPAGGARALLWLTDLAGAPATTAAAGARDVAGLTATAQAVAAYGWTVVAVGLGPETEGADERRASEFDRLRQLGLGASGTQSFALDVGRRSELDRPGALNVFLQPTSALVRALARESAGTLAGVESQLDAALDDLSHRLVLVYRTPAALDGALRSLEVRLLPDDLALRAVRWQRSGTPEAVAELHLAEAIAGERLGNGLKLRAVVVSGTRGMLLRVEPEVAAPGDESPSAGPVRLTWTADAGQIRHLVVSRPLAPGWVEQLPLATALARGTWAVAVEDLGSGSWGAAVAPSAP